ncbi:MAG TPA: HlyD family efflux transporter periplasmic adaptor subunit, partial [Vicinamibacterales bacterium]|nr:HlyD family efflux transporter periplasmic adaptor subunit [Vicinamibacterales bacterium]
MVVEVVTATEGPMQVTIDEEGETRVRERFVISAPVAGRITRIELEPGDEVRRGVTELVRMTPQEAPLLDPRTRTELSAAVEAARAAVGQAQAERGRAAASLSRARSALARQDSLADAGLIARDDLEAAQTAVTTADEAARAAEFAVSRAEYELQLARARLQTPGGGGASIQITAPIDGAVLKRLHESAAVVAAGEPLLEIGDPNQLEVVSDLLSTDAVRVPPRAEVLIDRWGGDHPLQGRVRRVEPSGFMKISALGVEEQRVNVIIDLADAAAARALGDGYRVEVRIIAWRAERVLKVPVGSLFRRGEGWALFIVIDGFARLQPVDLGERNDTEAQILGGVSAG